jgi:hypothetical protein
MVYTHYSVSVKDAIRAGKKNLIYIPLALIFIPSIIIAYTFFKNDSLLSNVSIPIFESIPNFNPILLQLLGVVCATLWRNFHVVSWKIWAFENVKDVHRLYQIACNKGMISQRGSWLNRLEYKNSDQRQRLAKLEARLDEPRQMETPAGFDLGSERSLNYSLKTTGLQFLFFLLVFGGITVAHNQLSSFPLFPLYFFTAFFVVIHSIRWIPRIGKPAPIRLTNTTLTIKDNQPIAWSNITDIYIETRRQRKTKYVVLIITTNTKPPELELEISEIEGGADKVEQMLYDYWVRGKNK